jgi:nucleotide-binding universal stress UspA family protein
MLRDIKNVLIGLTSEFGPSEISSAWAYGLSMAKQAGAHATIQSSSIKLRLHSTWMTTNVAGLVRAENRHLHTVAVTAARRAEANAKAEGIECTTAVPHLTYQELLTSFVRLARVHDLTIVDADADILSLDRGLIETLLTQSGRPLVIVPENHEVFKCERIILAWDGSAKAVRAANDALSLLRDAEVVQVLSVTGEKELPDLTKSADMVTHLALHGVRAVSVFLPADRGDVAETIRTAAKNGGADMIVMGGFVHSRLREMVLGGVTQSLLRQSPIPLFMSY